MCIVSITGRIRNNGRLFCGDIESIEVMAKRVAEEAKKNLEVNDMPLEEFIVKVDGVAEFLKSEI